MSAGVEKFGRGPFDKAIIRGFSSRMSPEEVSASAPILGTLTPAECLSRLDAIIRSKDILDAAMLAKLNLEDAYFLRNKLREQLDKSDYISKDDAAIFIKSLDAVQVRIEKSVLGFENQAIRMQEMHAHIMAQAIQVAFDKAAIMLSQQYSVPAEEAYRILEECLPLAVSSLEAEVA
jgi:hypothetical protein